MSERSGERSIRWPEKFSPTRAPVHVSNELAIDAPAEKIWKALIEAPLWPEWYVNSKNVRLLSGGATLGIGARFQWSTFGARIISEVAEFTPYERIAWTGKSLGIDVYHAWLITSDGRRSSVLTEETQYGLLARTAAALAPTRMWKFHQIWLEALERRAQSF